jgi:hypothetical protein
MSGFEAVGLALGIWPVVVNALESYKLAVSGQGWDLIYNEFRIEEAIYVGCVEHLLQGCVTEAELTQLCSREKPNQFLWKETLMDPRVRNSLERRLGPRKTPIVLETLQEIDRHLATLCRKIKTTDSFLVSILYSQIYIISIYLIVF